MTVETGNRNRVPKTGFDNQKTWSLATLKKKWRRKLKITMRNLSNGDTCKTEAVEILHRRFRNYITIQGKFKIKLKTRQARVKEKTISISNHLQDNVKD